LLFQVPGMTLCGAGCRWWLPVAVLLVRGCGLVVG
jgi:hypothetical protein